MTIEEKIEAALFGRVRTLAVTGDPPIVWPNLAFPEPGEEKPATYVEVSHLPNRNTRLFVRGSDPHLRQGILQLTVRTPLHDGQMPPMALAGEIAAHFPADLALFEGGIKVRIQQAPDVLQPGKSDDGVSWSAIVSVRYEAFA